jgi:hypothetical protein
MKPEDITLPISCPKPCRIETKAPGTSSLYTLTFDTFFLPARITFDIPDPKVQSNIERQRGLWIFV